MHRVLVLGGLVVLAPLCALAAAPEGKCRIRRAEAVVCPAFQAIEDSGPLAVSGDGRTVVGSELSYHPGYGLPTRWVEGQKRAIEGLPEGMLGSASAVSRDGGVIAGFGVFPDDVVLRTFVWEGGEIRLFDGGPGAPRIPTTMSGDGSSIATVQDYAGSFLDPATGAFEDWLIPGEPIQARPEDMSDDGEVVTGWVLAGAVTAPVVREGDVSSELPVPMDGPLPEPGVALGVSPDGSLVVGGTWAYRHYWPTPPDDCGPADPCGALWRNGVHESRDYLATAATWEGAFWFEERLEGAALVRDETGEIRTIAAILEELGVEAPDFLCSVRDVAYDGHVVVGRTELIEPGQFRAVISPRLGIDIQPWSRSNRLDLWRRRPVVVRVYGSEQADATQVEPHTLRFGPERTGVSDVGPVRDFNRDGHLDRDFVFDPGAAGLAFGDREACVAGVAAGLPFRLCSHVRTTGGWWPWSWPFWRR